MKIYLAGPMRGIAKFNFPAFHEAAAKLRAAGHEVFSPAERDIERDGRDWSEEVPTGDEALATTKGFNLRIALGEDLAYICREADAVALLPGWEKSKGATAERATALALGLEIIDMGTVGGKGSNATRVGPDLHFLRTNLQNIYAQTKDELPLRYDIGNIYAQTKDEPALRYDIGKVRYELVPHDALEELAKVYSAGAKKYTDHNWLKGMSWSRCFGSLMRHCWAFWRGEELDQETGCHHMAMAAWNCFALVTYHKRKLGTDDRPRAFAKDENTVDVG